MTEPAPINPLMRARLPDMIERINGARRSMRDLLAPIAVDLDALSDFLDFEIDKATLALDRAEWSNQAQTDVLRKRAAYLKAVRDTVDSGRFETPINYLEEIIGVITQLRSESD